MVNVEMMMDGNEENILNWLIWVNWIVGICVMSYVIGLWLMDKGFWKVNLYLM